MFVELSYIPCMPVEYSVPEAVSTRLSPVVAEILYRMAVEEKRTFAAMARILIEEAIEARTKTAR